MLTTDQQLRQETEKALGRPSAQRSTGTSTREWLWERIDGGFGALVGAAFFVLFSIGAALEPRSSEPVPALGVALSVGFFTLLGVMAAGLIFRRRWGLAAALGASVLLTAMSVACPTSGHHAFGAWWFAQMACSLGMVGISAFALRRA